MLDRYIIPIAPYLLFIFGLVGCSYLFFMLQREIQELRRGMARQQKEIEEMTRDFIEQTKLLQAGIREAEERTGVLVAPEPPKSGLNLSKRSQVLRMSRSGEDPRNIASALNLPRNEVELLLKVQRIVLTEPGAVTS